MESRQRRLLVGAPLAVFSVIAVFARLRQWAPQADLAVFWLRLHDMPAHIPLYGAYSRFQWHHPGPAMYYVYWPLQKILGSNPSSLLAITLLWHGVALSVGTWLAVRIGGRKFGVAYILGSCALAVGVGTTEMMTPWNPYLNVFVFPAFVLAAWALAQRDKVGLLLVVILGSLCVQNHVGLAVPVGMIAIAAVVAAVLNGGATTLRRDFSIGQVALAAGAGALMWAPPVIEQLTHDPGNFGLLAQFFRNSSSEAGAPVGFRHAAGILGEYLGFRSPWMFGSLAIDQLGGGVIPRPRSNPAGWPLVAAAATPIMWFVRPTRKWRTFALLLVVGAVSAFIALARITGPPFPYLLVWIDGLAMLFGAGAVTVLANAVVASAVRPSAVLRSRGLITPNATDAANDTEAANPANAADASAAPVAATGGNDGGARRSLVPTRTGQIAAIAVACAALIATGVAIERAPEPYADRESIVTSLSAQVRDDLTSLGIKPGSDKIIAFGRAGSNEGRTFITAVMVQLELDGYHTKAHPDEEVGVGAHRVVDPPPMGWGYIITDGATSIEELANRPDLVEVAHVDQFTPAERQKLAKLEQAAEAARAEPDDTEFEKNIKAAVVQELLAFRANRLDVAIFRFVVK